MRQDYHLHSLHSFDSTATIANMCDACRLLDDVCFTEHVDFDAAKLYSNPPVMLDYAKDMEGRKMGIEAGLDTVGALERAKNYTAGYELDFIIGSVHIIPKWGDPYEPKFFVGREKADAYRGYLDGVRDVCLANTGFNALGHIDYVAKKAPYRDRTLKYSHNPDAFDAIFRHIIQNGIALEINTGVYLDTSEPLWGLDYLRRYVDLGGEVVTFGSDAHTADRVGFRLDEAQALAVAAGIKYIASFTRLQPTMYKM